MCPLSVQTRCAADGPGSRILQLMLCGTGGSCALPGSGCRSSSRPAVRCHHMLQCADYPSLPRTLQFDENKPAEAKLIPRFFNW